MHYREARFLPFFRSRLLPVVADGLLIALSVKFHLRFWWMSWFHLLKDVRLIYKHTLIQVRHLVTSHPKLDLGSKMKTPSYGNVAAYDWS